MSPQEDNPTEAERLKQVLTIIVVAKKPVLTHLCESMLRIECIYAEVAE
jgi:hypothetical protein